MLFKITLFVICFLKLCMLFVICLQWNKVTILHCFPLRSSLLFTEKLGPAFLLFRVNISQHGSQNRAGSNCCDSGSNCHGN